MSTPLITLKCVGHTQDQTVTVVIPAFRAAVVIERAIQSVQAQTLTVSEIIIVDDASDDETASVVQRIAETDHRIRLIVNGTNIGPGNSRNLAWDCAVTDFVAFLDADDTWEANKVELQINWFNEHRNEVLCATDHRVVNEAPRASVEPGYSRFSVSDLLIKNRFTTPSVMVRREIAARFDDRLRLSEDYLLWTRIAADHGGVCRLNQQLTVLHKPIYGASGLSSNNIAMFRGEITAFGLMRQMKIIGMTKWCIATIWSSMKFVRRLPTATVRRRRWKG